MDWKSGPGVATVTNRRVFHGIGEQRVQQVGDLAQDFGVPGRENVGRERNGDGLGDGVFRANRLGSGGGVADGEGIVRHYIFLALAALFRE